MFSYLCALVIAATAIKIDNESAEIKHADEKTDQSKSFASMFFKKGLCPSIEFFKDLDLTKLEGNWFTHATINSYNMHYGAECVHSNCKLDSEDNSLKSELTLLVNGKQLKISGVRTFMQGSKVVTDMFGNRLHFVGDVLDTDYDNYVIDYGCFDGMSFQFDKEQEPVHLLMISISTRDASTSSEEIDRLIKLALEKAGEGNESEFVRHRSGETCEYDL